MYTKQDVIEYFQQVSLKERDMIFELQDTMVMLEDKELIARLKVIADDEVRHYALAQKTITAIMGAALERRLWERKYILGTATLRGLEEAREIRARCVDMSFGGICIDLEASEYLISGKRYQIKVEFFDKTVPINRVGKVRWIEKINDSLFTCGISFLEEVENIYIIPPIKNI
ncbi:MAG: PilZ domain-containing protein [Candidatus Omnitrophica bacterium]|nr:PilZ domain-containing protein [Candidatus Omnitrophota bacterium]